MEYKPTIGLEIHAELKTRTKMFCDSLNDPEEKHPNVNACPVCLGHPGILPTINKEAVAAVIKTGLALRGKINPVAKFDRKNYFYPDLPKGYQISQYDMPLVLGGELNGVRIRRVHLEEDTGTLVHVPGASLVDFNRAGVPLMELVTEPDIKSSDEAVAFARELQIILRYLGVSDAGMEKGQMRIEVNISMNMGTKTELKNINSFQAVRDAIDHEISRQTKILEEGGKVKQETRGWALSAYKGAELKTTSQRSKEEAHDYRYFPEPDLLPFETKVFEPEKLRESLPELPAAKRARFAKEYGLAAGQAEILVSEPSLADYFEEAVSEFRERPPAQAGLPRGSVATLYNYLASDLRGILNESGTGIADSKVGPEHLAHLAILIDEKKITSRQAKDMLAKMAETGLDPEEIVKKEGGTVSDEGELGVVVDAIIAENPAAAADYKKGKTASMQFLIGKAMGKLKGRGHPENLRKILEEKIAGND